MKTIVGRVLAVLRGSARARDIRDSTGVFAVGVLLISVGVVQIVNGNGVVAVDPWWHLVPLVVICGIMLVKRKHPMIALGIGLLVFGADVVIGGSLGVTLGLIDLIFAAALFSGPRTPRRLGIGVAVLVLFGAATTFVLGGGLRDSVLLALQVFAILGTPLWWGLSVRQQSELAELAAARAEDLERMAELREGDIVREERARMARDLHDALAGNLSAIAINAEAALERPSAETQRTALEAIRVASVQSLDEMRSMILLLRTDDDAVAAPPRLVEIDALVGVARARGLEVTVTVMPAATSALPSAVDQAAYRIVQESLTNAAKHAPGAKVEIDIDATPDALRLVIANELTAAASTQAGGGSGLLTMRERTEALGGNFGAGRDGSGRWVVDCSIPLRVLAR